MEVQVLFWAIFSTIQGKSANARLRCTSGVDVIRKTQDVERKRITIISLHLKLKAGQEITAGWSETGIDLTFFQTKLPKP